MYIYLSTYLINYFPLLPADYWRTKEPPMSFFSIPTLVSPSDPWHMRWFRCCREWCLLEYSSVEAAAGQQQLHGFYYHLQWGRLSNPQFIMVTKWLSKLIWCNQYDVISFYMLLTSTINGRGQRSLGANAAIDIWWYLHHNGFIKFLRTDASSRHPWTTACKSSWSQPAGFHKVILPRSTKIAFSCFKPVQSLASWLVVDKTPLKLYESQLGW